MTPNDPSSTGASLSSTGNFASVPCPACGGMLARRSHRSGLAEKMLSAMYVYPFRCQFCAHRFLSLQWGTRYHRVSVGHHDCSGRNPCTAGISIQPEQSPSLH